MNTRIFYAGLPVLVALMSAGANAQERPLQLTQNQQTTVYRTIVRESAAPQRPGIRKQTRQTQTTKQTQTRQTIRKPAVVRTTTTERIVTRPAPQQVIAPRQQVYAPQQTTIVNDPFDLTPDQRTVVYRTLVQPRVQREPIVTERIVTGPGTRPFVTTEPMITNAPPLEQRVITVPQTSGVATIVADEPVVLAPGMGPDIVIGARIPPSVPLYVMPPETAAAVPSIGMYRYALIGDRVYLVDPRDGIVAGMLYQ